MILQKQISKDFYKLFRTRNRESYMLLLVTLYQESSDVYSALGLTIEEGQAIISATMRKQQIEWQEDSEENAETSDTTEAVNPGTPAEIMRRLIQWGWLKSDYDERLNTYILSFPEYSRLYVELFEKLSRDDDSSERESILSIYSALFTYQAEKEKNNEILKSAWRTSKNLSQLLSNMQNGMRSYFEELSQSKNFIEIQQVLVDEINNNDSKRYAILTTSDSFYRYKEAVKELISSILNDADKQKAAWEIQLSGLEEGTTAYLRMQQSIQYCEEAVYLVYQVEREFDNIERRYNRLIEQKAVFARRALARIQYIFQEGLHDEDTMWKLLRLLDTSSHAEEILEQLRDRIALTTSYRMFGEDSLYKRREAGENPFSPVAVVQEENDKSLIADYVPKPLYSKRQLREFKEKNMQNGVFTTTAESVQSIEDLEKLMFLWQEMTQEHGVNTQLQVEEDIRTKEGYTFSHLHE